MLNTGQTISNMHKYVLQVQVCFAETRFPCLSNYRKHGKETVFPKMFPSDGERKQYGVTDAPKMKNLVLVIESNIKAK